MIEITERLQDWADPTATVTLPFELRQKSRLRVRLSTGVEAAMLLPRGTILRHGDLLRANSGIVIEVVAAPELVSTAHALDPLALARACYHLGNRHVPLQIGRNWLRYAQDHVLDEMVRGLGLTVHTERVPFEPEAGAYAHHHPNVLQRYGH